MNVPITHYDEQTLEYLVDNRQRRTTTGDSSRSRRASYRQNGYQPQQYNGMHRRRKRKMQW